MKTINFLGADLSLLQQSDPPDAAHHIGERSLEVPMARWVLALMESHRLIEVGAVLPYYHQQVLHRVVDPYDPWPPCDRRDALEVDFTGRDVISISTLEHVGLCQYGATEDAPLKGFQLLRKIIEQARKYFLTFPVGYNLQLDAAVQASIYPREMFVQTSPYNTWARLLVEDWSHAYNAPYPWANALCVLHNLTPC